MGIEVLACGFSGLVQDPTLTTMQQCSTQQCMPPPWSGAHGSRSRTSATLVRGSCPVNALLLPSLASCTTTTCPKLRHELPTVNVWQWMWVGSWWPVVTLSVSFCGGEELLADQGRWKEGSRWIRNNKRSLQFVTKVVSRTKLW